jgi:hypothetical protein
MVRLDSGQYMEIAALSNLFEDSQISMIDLLKECYGDNKRISIQEQQF